METSMHFWMTMHPDPPRPPKRKANITMLQIDDVASEMTARAYGILRTDETERHCRPRR